MAVILMNNSSLGHERDMVWWRKVKSKISNKENEIETGFHVFQVSVDNKPLDFSLVKSILTSLNGPVLDYSSSN